MMKRQSEFSLGSHVYIPAIVVGQTFDVKTKSYVVQFEAKGKAVHVDFSAEELQRDLEAVE